MLDSASAFCQADGSFPFRRCPGGKSTAPSSRNAQSKGMAAGQVLPVLRVHWFCGVPEGRAPNPAWGGGGCFRKGFLGAVIPESRASGCLRTNLATEGDGKNVPWGEATASQAKGLGPVPAA